MCKRWWVKITNLLWKSCNGQWFNYYAQQKHTFQQHDLQVVLLRVRFFRLSRVKNIQFLLDLMRKSNCKQWSTHTIYFFFLLQIFSLFVKIAFYKTDDYTLDVLITLFMKWFVYHSIKQNSFSYFAPNYFVIENKHASNTLTHFSLGLSLHWYWLSSVLCSVIAFYFRLTMTWTICHSPKGYYSYFIWSAYCITMATE